MSKRQTIWITGASSGIGKALALEYAPSGPELVLSARNADRLKEVAEECEKLGASTHVIPLDLSDQISIDNAWQEVRNQRLQVDLLVNNGGISQRSLVVDTPIELDRKMFEINYFGAVYLTKLVLPSMLERGRGHLAVVSSISGVFGFPLRSAYSATKHALEGFFESLHLENRKNGIYVSIIEPGRIRTEISKHALLADGKPTGEMDRGLDSGMPVDKCARKIRRGLDRKKRVIPVGGKELLMLTFKRFLPGVFFRIAQKVNPK